MKILYTRYSVCLKGQSALCAQHTPAYFKENELDKAKECARINGTQVHDMFKPMYSSDRMRKKV